MLDSIALLEECIRVLQSLSLKESSRPAGNWQDLDRHDRIGRFLPAAESSMLRCRALILLDRPGETSLCFRDVVVEIADLNRVVGKFL